MSTLLQVLSNARGRYDTSRLQRYNTVFETLGFQPDETRAVYKALDDAVARSPPVPTCMPRNNVAVTTPVLLPVPLFERPLWYLLFRFVRCDALLHVVWFVEQ